MKPELIYWDSCAFLGHLQAEPDKVQQCGGTLERAAAGEVGIITSALTITEVLWTKGSPKLPEAKATILKRFFRHSYIRVHNVTRTIAEKAQEVVWANNVRPKDAIHVATALSLGVPTLETFDDDLLRLSGKIGAPPLVIRQPLEPSQRRLMFDGK